MKCQNCQTENHDQAKFCKVCGTSLLPAQTIAEQKIEPEPPPIIADRRKANKPLIFVLATILLVGLSVAAYFLTNGDLSTILRKSVDSPADTSVNAENQHRSESEDRNLPGADNEVLEDYYLGTLGEKPFKLFIENVSGDMVEGYNVTGEKSRPVKGRIVNKWSEPEEVGSTMTVYRLILTEPGDDPWDGEFEIELRISDLTRYGSRLWKSYNGRLERKIDIVDRLLTKGYDDSQEIPGLYPEASLRLLTRNDLLILNKKSLKIMRNEIFARHGYIFKTEDMREYFTEQPWYQPQLSDVTSMLSEIEEQNIELIKSYE